MLQTLVFFLELSQAAKFCHAHTTEFFLPIVKSSFRNTHLSAHFLYLGTGLSLFQGKCGLFFGITCLFHVRCPLFSGEERQETLLYTGTEEREEIIFSY